MANRDKYLEKRREQQKIKVSREITAQRVALVCFHLRHATAASIIIWYGTHSLCLRSQRKIEKRNAVSTFAVAIQDSLTCTCILLFRCDTKYFFVRTIPITLQVLTYDREPEATGAPVGGLVAVMGAPSWRFRNTRRPFWLRIPRTKRILASAVLTNSRAARRNWQIFMVVYLFQRFSSFYWVCFCLVIW